MSTTSTTSRPGAAVRQRLELRLGLVNTTAAGALLDHMREHRLPAKPGGTISLPTSYDSPAELGVQIFSFQLDAWIASGFVLDQHRRYASPVEGYRSESASGRLPDGTRVCLSFVTRITVSEA